MRKIVLRIRRNHSILPRDLKTLDQIDWQFFGEEIKETVDDYVENLPEYRREREGLMLVGPTGRGKTMLAGAILHQAIERHAYYACFLRADDVVLMEQEKISLSKDRHVDGEAAMRYGEIDQTLRRIRGEKVGELPPFTVLVLDDLASRHLTEFGQGKLDALLRKRKELGLLTLVTSNVHPDQMAKEYGDRMASFLDEICATVEIVTDEEYRKTIRRERDARRAARIAARKAA